MVEFASEMIVPTYDQDEEITGRQRGLRLLFRGAIGAIDGTLVHAVVPTKDQTMFRGRGRHDCYQNVLGICDFNMIFTYVRVGWEGVAHDAKVLREAVFNPASGYPFPPTDKYYLGDAAYPNTKGLLAPYRGTRYWLADYRRRAAMTRQEKFNHSHAQLRNVIERSFGVLKARFSILKRMAPFPFTVQRDVVVACFAVHNFIRKYNINDELFAEIDQVPIFDGEMNEGGENEDGEQGWSHQAMTYMHNLREQLANQF